MKLTKIMKLTSIAGAIGLVWVTAGSAGKPLPPCDVSAGVTVGRTTVTGTTGNDVIDCQNARRGMTINGNGGDDFIVGGPKADVIRGNGLAQGNGGDDTIVATTDGNLNAGGGAGNDSIDLSAATMSSSATGGDGNDTIIGSESQDNLDGDDGDDSVSGEGGNDFINGYSGSDQLSGGDGDDELWDGTCPDAGCTGSPNDIDTYDAGETGETGGDACRDQDGRGTSIPGGNLGVVSPVQDDTLNGCEVVIVSP